MPMQNAGSDNSQIGTLTDAHIDKDVTDAQALGIDAFVLNFGMFSIF